MSKGMVCCCQRTQKAHPWFLFSLSFGHLHKPNITVISSSFLISPLHFHFSICQCFSSKFSSDVLCLPSPLDVQGIYLLRWIKEYQGGLCQAEVFLSGNLITLSNKTQ